MVVERERNLFGFESRWGKEEIKPGPDILILLIFEREIKLYTQRERERERDGEPKC